MKKSVRPFMAVAFLLFSLTLIQGTGCSKKTNEGCRTCKAISGDNIVDEEEVCSESEESAFRSKNSDAEISCN